MFRRARLPAGCRLLQRRGRWRVEGMSAEVAMKTHILAALLLRFGGALAQAQPSGADNIEASKLPESGPAMVGGTGQTVGPNYKNQAVSPMPGLRERELSERPPAAVWPPSSDVRPLPGPPLAPPAATPSAR